MYALGTFALLLPAVLVLPAFLWSRRKPQPESFWLLFGYVPPTVLWLLLIASGFGAQSLSNVIELLVLSGAAVVLPYLKVFILDRFTPHHRATTYTMLALLVALAFLLRAFMPALPE